MVVWDGEISGGQQGTRRDGGNVEEGVFVWGVYQARTRGVQL